MSTIANLLSLIDPSAIKPYSEGVESVNRAERGRQLNQTGLIELAELKRQQEAQQLARQYYQQHPEALMGPGGGPQIPTLATLGQPAPGGPAGGTAPPPGTAAQDPSRYAGVSPQGGGPIPPDVARQVTAQVTPPGAVPGGPPQGALGTQPQPQAGALMDLMRRNPEAAFAVMQQQQHQQDLALKRDEQRLTMGTKVAEYVGRVAQGVTSPETLEQARQELARIHPQAAAQLPQTYTKEAMISFVKKAVGVKDNALLQLETWKNQIEEQKLGVQLANAGDQGLGTDVTSILRGLTDEQVQQFGGRTSAKAIAYATGKVKDLDLEKREKEGLAGAQATVQAGREARQQQTLSEAFKGDTVNLYDTQTGRPLPSRMTVADYEQLPQTQVAQLSEDNRKQMENVNSAMPRLQILQTHIDAVYGPGGVLERMSPADRELMRSPLAIPTQIADQFAQKYPELAAARKYIDANAESLARALSGVRGAATESDVERAKAMLPNLTAALKVWPLSEAGLSLPDTRETALRTMNNLVDTLNGIGTGILGNPEYRTPLKKYENPENVPGPGLRAGEGSVRITPRNAPRQAPRGSTPPAPDAVPPDTGPPTFGPGDPTQQLPPRTPAPVSPPASRTAPTPDEAYRRLMRPPAPLPATPPPGPPTFGPGDPTQQLTPGPRPAPTTQPTPPSEAPSPGEAYRRLMQPPAPGRQSQARPVASGDRVAQLAGAPKVMNLADVALAVQQTGRSRADVEKAARARGYVVYGSKLPLPEVTMVG